MSHSQEAGPISAAIIGAGAVGGYHVKAQIELGSKVTVYDPSQACLDRVVGTYGVEAARSLEEAAEGADVVHICTPAMVHMENTLESIGLGKPTIVEKPLTHDLGEALEIYKAAQAAGVTVLTGMHFRLTPPFMSINEGVQRGDVGPVTSIESNYVHDMGRVKVGAEWRKKLGPNGFLYEGAAHPLDLNMWIAGQPVNEVQATFGSRKMRPEFNWREDYAITLTYADGTLGRVWSNAAAPMPIHGAALAVYGGDGVYAAHNKYPELKYYRDGDRDWTVTPTAEIGQTIRPMAELFHGYLRGERDTLAPMPTLEEAIGVMIVLNTVEVAAASGQTEKVPSLQEVLARQ